MKNLAVVLGGPCVIGCGLLHWAYLFLISVFLTSSCSKDKDDVVNYEPYMKICALISACSKEVKYDRMSQVCYDVLIAEGLSRVNDLWGKLHAARLACLKEASNCDETLACMYASGDQVEACSDINIDRACVNGVRVDCNSQYLDIQDCDAAGLVCTETGNGAICVGETCDPSTDTPHCEDNAVLICDTYSETEWFTDCVAQGGICEEDSNGIPDCVGAGEDCDPDTFEEYCDDDIKVICLDRRIGRVDCSREFLGGICMTGYVSSGCYRGDECGDGDAEECNDGVISFCVLGKKHTLDCKNYGLSGCELEEGLMYPGAYCLP